MTQVVPGFRLWCFIHHADIVVADIDTGKIECIQNRLQLPFQLHNKHIRTDILRGRFQIKGGAWPGLQALDQALCLPDLLLGDLQDLGNASVLLLAQRLQMLCNDGAGKRRWGVQTVQLQQQTVFEIPRGHTGRLQGLEGTDRLLNQLIWNAQLLHAFQILGPQIAVRIQQFRQVFAQGQYRRGQLSALQLVTKKGGERLCFPIPGAGLLRGAVVSILLRGMVEAGGGIQPADLLLKLMELLLQGRRILFFKGGVFLRQRIDVLQQLLRIHLQDLHGLQQLGGQAEPLLQSGF